MAAIAVSGGRFNSVQVFKHVEQFLPTYARPRFIRIQVGKSGIYPPIPDLRAIAYGAVVSGLAGRHGNLQVREDKAGGGRFRPESDLGPSVLSGRKNPGLRPTDTGHVQRCFIRENKNMNLLDVEIKICVVVF